MNKKIKIIELLSKIANGEEPPKRIKVKDYIFIWKISENGTGYYNEKEGTGYYWLEDYISLDNARDLNTEVEILEDNTEEIEELPDYNYSIKWNRDKINELVKAINYIVRKINEK